MKTLAKVVLGTVALTGVIHVAGAILAKRQEDAQAETVHAHV